MSNRVCKVVPIVASLLLLIGWMPIVHAQETEEERITLSPAVIQPEFDKGQTAEGKLTVINDGEIAYTFLVYARPFSVEGELYEANYTEINERTEAYQWVQFSQTEFTLQPGQQVEVPYSIQVPDGVAGGGYYAVLFAETQPKPTPGAASVGRKKRVGSLAYMTVSGDINRSGSVASWSTNLLQTSQPVSSLLRMKNDGNVHYQADLVANYSSIFGKKLFTLNQQVLVLPGTTRQIPIQWQNAPIIGIFKANAKVSYLEKSETLPTKYVILIPKPVLIGLAVCTVLIVLFVLIRKKHKNKKSKSVRRNK